MARDVAVTPKAGVGTGYACPDARATAKLQVRHIRLSLLADFPPYDALTATGSLSRDGKTLYLIVLNKHHAAAIDATLVVRGKAARAGRYWTVSAPSLDAMNRGKDRVRETLTGAPVADLQEGRVTLRFPKLSMTALELTGGHD